MGQSAGLISDKRVGGILKFADRKLAIECPKKTNVLKIAKAKLCS